MLDLAQVDRQVKVELGVRLGASILHINKPYSHGEILIGHQVLLVEHLEIDHLPLAEADDYLIQLERAHCLHRELPSLN